MFCSEATKSPTDLGRSQSRSSFNVIVGSCGLVDFLRGLSTNLDTQLFSCQSRRNQFTPKKNPGLPTGAESAFAR